MLLWLSVLQHKTKCWRNPFWCWSLHLSFKRRSCNCFKSVSDNSRRKETGEGRYLSDELQRADLSRRGGDDWGSRMRLMANPPSFQIYARAQLFRKVATGTQIYLFSAQQNLSLSLKCFGDFCLSFSVSSQILLAMLSNMQRLSALLEAKGSKQTFNVCVFRVDPASEIWSEILQEETRATCLRVDLFWLDLPFAVNSSYVLNTRLHASRILDLI